MNANEVNEEMFAGKADARYPGTNSGATYSLCWDWCWLYPCAVYMYMYNSNILENKLIKQQWHYSFEYE